MLQGVSFLFSPGVSEFKMKTKKKRKKGGVFFPGNVHLFSLFQIKEEKKGCVCGWGQYTDTESESFVQGIYLCYQFIKKGEINGKSWGGG